LYYRILLIILANDAAPVPPPNPSHGSYHWTFERLISAGLIPLTIAPFAAGSLNPMMDALLCGTILVHSHIGFEAMVTDYIPRKRLPKTRQVFNWGLKAATVLVGVGLYEFETNDVGVTEAIKRIWTA
jgi:succinate dehydrogenase (ubiquinone) membrane anchor subunit